MTATNNVWRQVWNERDADRADWNGYEQCFASAADYERFVAEAVTAIVRLLRIGPDDRVLDIGCVSGRLTQAVAGYAGEVVGIDFSESALDVARTRRQATNARYELVDLNVADPAALSGYDKVFSFGALLYLQDHETVRCLIDGLVGSGADVLLLDVPDADVPDRRAREYDQTTYRHLRFTPAQVRQWSSDAQILRGLFPGYVNDPHRFAVLIPGHPRQ